MSCSECGVTGGPHTDISVRKHETYGTVCTVCFPASVYGYYREREVTDETVTA